MIKQEKHGLVLHPVRNHSNSAEYFASLQGGGGKWSGVVPPLTDDNAADGKIGRAVTMVTGWMQY